MITCLLLCFIPYYYKTIITYYYIIITHYYGKFTVFCYCVLLQSKYYIVLYFSIITHYYIVIVYYYLPAWDAVKLILPGGNLEVGFICPFVRPGTHLNSSCQDFGFMMSLHLSFPGH